MGATFSASAIFRAVDMISAPARRMESSLQRINGTIRDITKTTLSFGAAFTAGAILKSGVDGVVKYDEAIASLKAVTGVTGSAFIPFKKEIKAIGDEFRRGYPEVAKTMELIGSAQPELLKSAKGMGEMTKAAILLSKASGMDQAQAAASLTNTMNQFGVGPEMAAKFVDILSTSEQKGTATIANISAAMENLGPVAKTLGISFDNTNAIIQAFAKGGIMGSDAGTKAAAALSRMARSTNSNYNPAVVGATKAIDNLAKAHLTLPQLIKMYGAEGARYIATLINQNDVVQGLAGNLYEQGNAQLQANERMKAFTERVKELKNRFTNLFITGDETSGMLRKFGAVIGFVTNHLGFILGTIGLLITYYALWRTWLLITRAAMIAKNIVLGVSIALHNGNVFALRRSTIAMNAYKVATAIVSKVQWAWNAALAAGLLPVTLIAAGIGALIGLIIGLTKRWHGIIQAFKEGGFIEGLKAIGKALLSIVLAPLEWILKVIGKLTGAKWATEWSNSLKEFRGGMDEGLIQNKDAVVVNKDAAVLTQKKVMESRETQRAEIFINDSTGRAQLSGQLSPFPIKIINTKGGFGGS